MGQIPCSTERIASFRKTSPWHVDRLTCWQFSETDHAVANSSHRASTFVYSTLAAHSASCGFVLRAIWWTGNVGTPKGRPTWWSPPPQSRWCGEFYDVWVTWATEYACCCTRDMKCKYVTFWGLHFFGGEGSGGSICKKYVLCFLLPADSHHVLKFRKDSFRGIDEIGSK